VGRAFGSCADVWSCPAAEYAQVLKMHGGPWLEAYCFDGQKRMCHICGKMGRKVRIAVGDIVLISLRGFQVLSRPPTRPSACLPACLPTLPRPCGQQRPARLTSGV
jgi:translation initiation factor IF-1